MAAFCPARTALPTSLSKALSCLRVIWPTCLKTVQITFSVQGGAVSDPRYLKEDYVSFTRTRGFAIPPNFDAPVKFSSDVGKQECEGEGRPYDVGGSRLRYVGKDVVEVIQIVADGHVHLVKGGEGGETVGRVGRLLGTAVLGVVVQDLDLHRELRLCIER